jgi:hypothetical protein
VVASEELVDLYLVERWPRERVRESIEVALRDEVELLDLHDVWLRAPGLAASVVAADYVAILDAASSDASAAWDELSEAVTRLLAADRLPRDRGGQSTEYDIRALIDHVAVVSEHAADGEDRTLRVEMRLRIDPNSGYGRPEEVLDILGEQMDIRLVPLGPIVRGRVYLSPI